MFTFNRIIQIALIAAVVFLAACEGVQNPNAAPQTPRPPAIEDIPARLTRTARDFEDAVATADAHNAVIGAQTAVAVAATAAAEAQATATMEAKITATAEVRAAIEAELGLTRIHAETEAEAIRLKAQAEADALVMSASAVGTAAAIHSLIKEDADAQAAETKRRELYLQREQATIEKEQQQARLYRWLQAGVFFVIAGIIAAIVYWLWQRDIPRIYRANGHELVLSGRPVQVVDVPHTLMAQRPRALLADSGPPEATGIGNPSAALAQFKRASWQAFLNWGEAEKIPLGVGGDGKPILLDTQKTPHLAVFGRSGSGKTRRFLLPMALYFLRQQVRVVIINERGADFQILRAHPLVEIVHPPLDRNSVSDIVEKRVREIVSEIDRRDGVLNDLGISTWSRLPAHINESPELVVIVDEFLDAAMSARNGSGLMRDLVTLTSEGRKYGIRVILAATDPTERALGREGMTIRGQCARICLSLSDDGPSRAVLGNTQAVGLPDGHFVAKINGPPQYGLSFSPNNEELAQYLRSAQPSAATDFWRQANAVYHQQNGHGAANGGQRGPDEFEQSIQADARLLDRLVNQPNLGTLNAILTWIDNRPDEYPGWNRNGDGFRRLKRAMFYRAKANGCAWAQRIKDFPWDVAHDQEFMGKMTEWGHLVYA